MTPVNRGRAHRRQRGAESAQRALDDHREFNEHEMRTVDATILDNHAAQVQLQTRLAATEEKRVLLEEDRLMLSLLENMDANDERRKEIIDSIFSRFKKRKHSDE